MQNGSLFPIYHGSAKNNIGTEKLIEVIAETFTSGADNDQSELCGSVFTIEYTDQKKRLVYLRLYSGTLHLRDTILLPQNQKLKITEMRIPSNGEIIPADTFAAQGMGKKSDSFASDDGGAAKSGTKRPPAECPDGNCRYRSAVALLCGYDNA